MTSSENSGVGHDGANRLRALVETGVALSSELTIDSLLRRPIETAVEPTSARYRAPG
jgi:hypothetical protein